MKKAIFINGGIGRVLCALPALEHYAKTTDPSVVIVAEAWPEVFALSDVLRNNIYPAAHKGLMDILKGREIISPEPYRLNAYFNQEANLIQAFDMLINYKQPPKNVPETKEFSLKTSRNEDSHARNLIAQIKKETGKSKVVVFQPLGSTARVEGDTVIDPSGRSIEHKDIITMTKALTKDYAVILMTNLDIPANEPMGAALLSNTNMLQWASIISQSDYFIGCDSAGQHFANAVNKPATVIIGSTFPENISYPNNPNFNIVDLGKGRRIYSPIRITQDEMIERNNEGLMEMSSTQVNEILAHVKSVLSTTKH